MMIERAARFFDAIDRGHRFPTLTQRFVFTIQNDKIVGARLQFFVEYDAEYLWVDGPNLPVDGGIGSIAVPGKHQNDEET